MTDELRQAWNNRTQDITAGGIVKWANAHTDPEEQMEQRTQHGVTEAQEQDVRPPIE